MSDEDYGVWMDTEEVGQPEWLVWAVAIPVIALVVAALVLLILKG